MLKLCTVDRGAPNEEYRTGMAAVAVRKRRRCRSEGVASPLAGSSDNIRPAVAFVRSAIISISYYAVFEDSGSCLLSFFDF